MKNILNIARGRFFWGLFLFVLLAVAVWGIVSMARAAATDNLSGYAWSSTIGWVSMNCTTGGNCGTSNYGVKIDGNGLMSGYAWSSNAGWVSFNTADLAGCPTAPCEARFNQTTGFATGWARALAGTGPSYEIGGWGGWLHLAGTGHQVKAVGCSWEGYAWGGGSTENAATVGWLSFKGSNYGVIGTGVACRTTPAQCNDGLDNDSDSLADYPPGDPGCSGTGDDSETNGAVAQCADGVDNDADGKIDLTVGNPDPGCVNAADDNETNPATPACSDLADNDGDTKIDYGGANADPGCTYAGDPTEENPAQCADGYDNDGDTKVDYPVPPGDRGCTSAADNDEYNPKECADGVDNDGDTKIDYGVGPTFDLQCSSLEDDSEATGNAQLTLYPTTFTVRPGQTTTLTWGVVDVQANSCTLVGTNGDSWTLTGTSGTQTTAAISQQTVYTLSCSDLSALPVSQSTTIKILPRFDEF